jgi:hypothetical protein
MLLTFSLLIVPSFRDIAQFGQTQTLEGGIERLSIDLRARALAAWHCLVMFTWLLLVLLESIHRPPTQTTPLPDPNYYVRYDSIQALDK